MVVQGVPCTSTYRPVGTVQHSNRKVETKMTLSTVVYNDPDGPIVSITNDQDGRDYEISFDSVADARAFLSEALAAIDRQSEAEFVTGGYVHEMFSEDHHTLAGLPRDWKSRLVSLLVKSQEDEFGYGEQDEFEAAQTLEAAGVISFADLT